MYQTRLLERKKPLPPDDVLLERLKEELEYDRENGCFYRKKRAGPIAPGDLIGAWGCRVASGKRYRVCTVMRMHFQVHRLVWLFEHGRFPEGVLDHIDGDPGNNRISNLRVCTVSQNTVSRPVQKNNRLGIKGVGIAQDGRKFKAVVYVKMKTIYLGAFDTIEEAQRVQEHHSRKLHGEFHWESRPPS